MGTVELNVLEVMKEKRINPEALAVLPEIGEEGLNKIVEGSVSAVRLSSLAAICDALQCSPEDVLKYTV